MADLQSYAKTLKGGAGNYLNPAKVIPQRAPSIKSPVEGMEKVQSFTRAIKKAMLLQKIAKVLEAGDKPTNAPTEIHAEGSEATTLANDDSRKATDQASDALGKATKGFTMERSQSKGTDPSMIHAERGSGRDQDSKKIAALIKIAAMKKQAATAINPPDATGLRSRRYRLENESAAKSVADQTASKAKTMRNLGLAAAGIGAVGAGAYGINKLMKKTPLTPEQMAQIDAIAKGGKKKDNEDQVAAVL